jgi:hypothetical protein
VESSCKLGNGPSGFIKCWELPSGAQLVVSRAVLTSTELVVRLSSSRNEVRFSA